MSGRERPSQSHEAASPINLFTMYGAREILALSAGAVHIEKQVNALEGALAENPALVFDLGKSLIESVCKTILTDRGHTIPGKPDLPKLFRETINSLLLVPDTHADVAETRGSLKKMLNGLITTVQGICELRSTEGIASHGKDAYSASLESNQALLVAGAADTIVGYLYKIHKGNTNVHAGTRLHYTDHQDFHDYVDDIYEPAVIFGSRYKASEILFYVDLLAYRQFLIEFANQEQDDEQESGQNS